MDGHPGPSTAEEAQIEFDDTNDWWDVLSCDPFSLLSLSLDLLSPSLSDLLRYQPMNQFTSVVPPNLNCCGHELFADLEKSTTKTWIVVTNFFHDDSIHVCDPFIETELLYTDEEKICIYWM